MVHPNVLAGNVLRRLFRRCVPLALALSCQIAATAADSVNEQELVLKVFICGNGICESWAGETPATCPDDCPAAPVILAATMTGPPSFPLKSHGDLWFSTWDGKDNLYIAWGDGCGPGLFFYDPDCPQRATDTGIACFTGALPLLDPSSRVPAAVRCLDAPTGIPRAQDRDDKPSSILYLDGALYLAGHTPLWQPDYGYIAVSTDGGRTFREQPNSPWTKAAGSVFRCLMFINHDNPAAPDPDKWIYGLGIGWKWDWDVHGGGRVYLTRVPRADIANYPSYEYFAGSGTDGQPQWTTDQTTAAPVPGLTTNCAGSALYHSGCRRYLFLSENGLFEAQQPWGPWIMSARLFVSGEDPAWQGGYMPAIIPRDTGPDSFYFFVSGQDIVIGYRLHLGQVRLTLREDIK